MNETNTYQKLKNEPQNNFPNKIVIHHTGGTAKDPKADTSHHTANIVETGHLSLGWDGIGYHYFIHKDGEVWRGRPEHRNGAHAGNPVNFESIAICLAGNFDVTLPTEKQIESLKHLLVDIMERYNISPDRIYPHRKFANKSCYGSKLKDDWASGLVTMVLTESPNNGDMVSIPRSLLQELIKYIG